MMGKGWLVIILIFLGSGKICSQKISKADIEKDLTYMNKYLEQWHPSYHRYTTPEYKDSLIQNWLSQQKDSVGLRSIRYFLSSFVQKMGCGHTTAGLPKSYQKTKVKVMPMLVLTDGDRVFVRRCDQASSPLKPGDEILKLNDYTAKQLLDTIKNMIQTDGYNTTHVDIRAEKYFHYFYNHVFGPVDSVFVQYLNGEGKQLNTVLYGSYDLSVAEDLPHQLVDTTRCILGPEGGMSLQLLPGVNNGAVLKITSFSGGGQKKLRKKIFRYLREKNIQHLVLDLRGNGGGNVFRGNALIAQFDHRPVTGIHFGKKVHTAIFCPKFKTDFGNRLSGFSFMLNPLSYPSRKGWMHIFPFFRKSNRYDGPLYIMTDGATFSMASSVASKLRFNRKNTFTFGEESGGGAAGSGGMLRGGIELPSSKLRVEFHIYWYQIDKDIQDVGRGVMPDVPVNYDLESKQKGKDPGIQKVVDWILLNAG